MKLDTTKSLMKAAQLGCVFASLTLASTLTGCLTPAAKDGETSTGSISSKNKSGSSNGGGGSPSAPAVPTAVPLPGATPAPAPQATATPVPAPGTTPAPATPTPVVQNPTPAPVAPTVISLSTLSHTSDATMGLILKGINAATTPSGTVSNLTVAATSNCQAAFAQVGGNLNTETNPNKANFGAATHQLIFSCCSDVVAQNRLLAFGIAGGAATTLGAAATNRPQISAAAVKILDQYTANLASTGPNAAAISGVFNTQLAAMADTTTVGQAFTHACLAAVGFGATMTGF